MTDETAAMTAQDALIAVMTAVSVSDQRMRTAELVAIERIVIHLPVFAGYDVERIKHVAQTVLDLLTEEDGLDALFGLVRVALPERLFETAYALACDVAAADGTLREIELAMLEEIRDQLRLHRLLAAAIETGARARHQRA